MQRLLVTTIMAGAGVLLGLSGTAHDTRAQHSARRSELTRAELARRVEPLTTLGSRPCSAGHRGRNLTLHSCGETHHASLVLARPSGQRPVRLTAAAWGGLRQSHPGVLAFGCVTATRCGGSWVAQYGFGACPPPKPIWEVLNLDTIGRHGQVAPLPLQRYREREPRGPTGVSHATPAPKWPLATRLLRLVRPRVAIWFERSRRPEVLAWGGRLGAARRYARIVKVPFREASHRTGPELPGTSTFAVGLPPRRQAGRIRYAGGVWDLDVRWDANGR